MQEFSWRAREPTGKLLRGKVRAGSKQEAANLVRASYGYVVGLRTKEDNFLLRWQAKLFKGDKSLSDKQKIVFFKQLAVILNSGVPLLKGMELLQQRTDIFIGRVCRKLEVNLREGMSLANAMQECGKTFPNLAVTLVAAGERSGELNTVLLELAAYYSKQQAMKQFLYKATLYPLFLLGASFSVLVFFLLYVLPMLATVYAGLGAQPTKFLKLALSINEFVLTYNLELGILLLMVLGVIYRQRIQFVNFCLELPGIRKIHSMLLEIRFCKLLGLLLDKGISITQAVDVATVTISGKERIRQLKLFRLALHRGEAISLAVGRVTEMFSPITAELIAIGAETGYLPKLLNEAAEILEQDLQERLEKIRELLSPLLLLLAALIIALVVCSVIGPLFELFTVLPEYN